MNIEFLYLLYLLIAIILARSVTTLIHELGHAIPSLLFSKGPVNVYVGSYGTEEKYLKIKLSRLCLYFRVNFLNWRIGMCTHEKIESSRKQLIVILGGPFASLFLAITIIIIMSIYSLPISIIYILTCYVLSSLYDFIINLVPAYIITELSPHGPMMSDGMAFVYLLSFGKYYNEYNKILDTHQDNKTQILQELQKLQEKSQNKTIGLIYVNELIDQQKFQEAYQFCKSHFENNTPTNTQLAILGDVYYGLGQKEDALKYYTTYLFHKRDDYHIKNKKAKILFELNNEIEAMKLFQNSLHQNPHDNPQAYLYLGKILTNLKNSEALNYLQIAFHQSGKDPETVVAIAQYYEKNGQASKAKKYYKYAKFLGSIYHGLEYKIATI